MLMGKNAVLLVASLLIFFNAVLLNRCNVNPIFEVVVNEDYWTNIVESVQIFEDLSKVPSKYPLHQANEFQILEPLLVAMVSGLVNHFCSFSLNSFHFIYVST